MKKFDEFSNYDVSFWAFIKFISETLKYTDKKTGKVKVYSEEEITSICKESNTEISADYVGAAIKYAKMRADLLNDSVQRNLMDSEAACQEYRKWETEHRLGNYYCKIPLNKQKGKMKQVAYFTSIINILAEKTIRDITNEKDKLEFDDDPRGLTYVWDEDRRIIGASSRRFDGAYPSIYNPKLVWEIKEYYYATTFGSRIADGVYETQLDGFELNELKGRTGYHVYHVLFIDAYHTWWIQGKSYLCRLVDAINSGEVDEVIVGKEVLSRWPELLKEIVK